MLLSKPQCEEFLDEQIVSAQFLLIVDNLTLSHYKDSQDLYNFFSKYGFVRSIIPIPLKSDSAAIEYDNPDSVSIAASRLDSTAIKPTFPRLVCRRALDILSGDTRPHASYPTPDLKLNPLPENVLKFIQNIHNPPNAPILSNDNEGSVRKRRRASSKHKEKQYEDNSDDDWHYQSAYNNDIPPSSSPPQHFEDFGDPPNRFDEPRSVSRTFDRIEEPLSASKTFDRSDEPLSASRTFDRSDDHHKRRTKEREASPVQPSIGWSPFTEPLVDAVVVIQDISQSYYAREIQRRCRHIGLMTQIDLMPEDASFSKAQEYWAKQGIMFLFELHPSHERLKTANFHCMFPGQDAKTHIVYPDWTLDMCMQHIFKNECFYLATQFEQVATRTDHCTNLDVLRNCYTPRPIAYLLSLIADNRYVNINELTTCVNYLERKRQNLSSCQATLLPSLNEELISRAQGSLALAKRCAAQGTPQVDLQKHIADIVGASKTEQKPTPAIPCVTGSITPNPTPMMDRVKSLVNDKTKFSSLLQNLKKQAAEKEDQSNKAPEPALIPQMNMQADYDDYDSYYTQGQAQPVQSAAQPVPNAGYGAYVGSKATPTHLPPPTARPPHARPPPVRPPPSSVRPGMPQPPGLESARPQRPPRHPVPVSQTFQPQRLPPPTYMPQFRPGGSHGPPRAPAVRPPQGFVPAQHSAPPRHPAAISQHRPQRYDNSNGANPTPTPTTAAAGYHFSAGAKSSNNNNNTMRNRGGAEDDYDPAAVSNYDDIAVASYGVKSKADIPPELSLSGKSKKSKGPAEKKPKFDASFM